MAARGKAMLCKARRGNARYKEIYEKLVPDGSGIVWIPIGGQGVGPKRNPIKVDLD